MTTAARRALLGAAVATAVGLVVASFFLPVGAWATSLARWMRGSGFGGAAVFALAYVGAALLALPGSVLTATAGFAYGPGLGLLLVSPVSVVAATAAFILGRTVARDWVARRVRHHPRFAALDEAVGTGGWRGFQIVALLRLSPIVPFNVLNYALGLTKVRLRDYVVGSFVGMLPGTFLYVYLGSAVTNLAALHGGHQRGGAWGQIVFWGGLAATIVVTIVVTRLARRALKSAVTGKRQTALRGLKEAKA